MPKNGKSFDGILTFGCAQELHEQLVALSYLRGEKGEYAGLCRDMLLRCVKQELGKMTPVERREFDSVLANVSVQSAIRRQKLAEGKLDRRAREVTEGAADSPRTGPE